jgi:hypothetical protein
VASGGAEIHPQQIYAHGETIKSAAAQSQALNVSTQHELAGYGEPWGTDLIGSLMGVCYQVITGAAMESFTSNAAAMHEHGTRVQAMATAWQQAENTNAKNASSVSKPLR